MKLKLRSSTHRCTISIKILFTLFLICCWIQYYQHFLHLCIDSYFYISIFLSLCTIISKQLFNAKNNENKYNYFQISHVIIHDLRIFVVGIIHNITSSQKKEQRLLGILTNPFKCVYYSRHCES